MGMKPKHGYSGTPIYQIWGSMLHRCRSPNDMHYDAYGERGITVCERWFRFENFLADMGQRPKGRSLDRIDNSKGYAPDNCRWATKMEQQRNMRRNTMVHFQGRDMWIAEAAGLTGITANCITKRLLRGWPVEKALAA